MMKSLGLTAAIVILLSSGAQAATYVSLGGLGGGLGGYPAPAAVAPPMATSAPAATAPAQSSQTQNLSNLMNNQGAPYGQKGKGEQSGSSSTNNVKYHYRVPNPNDPLETVPIPPRLYSDQPHVYYNDNCICVAGPY